MLPSIQRSSRLPLSFFNPKIISLSNLFPFSESLMAKSETMTVKRSRRSNPIDSPPVKKFPRVEAVEDEVQGDQGDICQNWGSSISFHREYEEKLAELEEKLRQAKEESDFYFWKAEELESRLFRNLLLQLETSQNTHLIEESGENDSATSACSSVAQSGGDKWTCKFCGRKEARAAVQPCGHLCLCFDCSFLTLSSRRDKCPVCRARITDLFFIHTS